MTAPPPRHAQPSALTTFGWAAGLRWTMGALLIAVAVGAATTIGTAPRPAAAAPKPVLMASTGSDTGSEPGPTSTSASSMPPTATSTTASATARDEQQQASSLAADGIPTTALRAYQDAARHERTLDPTCGLSWPLLAAIGRVESDPGRFAGAVLYTDGVSIPRVIGIALDGHGTDRITDTDHGRFDGDRVYDRAVRPMQFIPSTWAGYRVDGNGDGVADPFNIFDAAAAAVRYLCSAGGDLTTLAGQTRAVLAYNHSAAYLSVVLHLERVYARGVPGLTVPIVPAHPSAPKQHPTVPPVNPGPPLGAPRHPKKSTTSSAPTTSTSSTGPPCPAPSASDTATGTSSGTATQSATGTATNTLTADPSTSTSTSPAPSEPPCPTPSSAASTRARISPSPTISAPTSVTTSARSAESSAGA